jgi:predicted signal transduction protein with EAL and GGDEF domain
MRTTGEGIETQEQLAFLEQHGCTEAQGFLISKAIPGERVPALLADLDVLRIESVTQRPRLETERAAKRSPKSSALI